MSLDAVLTPPRTHARKPPFKRIKRVDGRLKIVRKSRELLAGYAKRLGMVANDPAVKDELLRLVEIEAVCWDWRARALLGASVDMITLNSMERFCRRIRMSLGLDKPKGQLRTLPEVLGRD